MAAVWPVYVAFAGCWVVGQVLTKWYFWHVVRHHDWGVDEVVRDIRFRMLFECDVLTRPLAIVSSWYVITYLVVQWYHTWSLSFVWIVGVWLMHGIKGA